MQFPWFRNDTGELLPVIECHLRRGSIGQLPIRMLLDTGAHSCTLPATFVERLAFRPEELTFEEAVTAAGPYRLPATAGDPGVEIRIGDDWLKVPALTFGPWPVLGRDFIFAYFSVTMTHGMTELTRRQP